MSVVSSLGEVSGVPVIDREACIRCGDCAVECPTGVLTMGPDGVVVDLEAGFSCIACAHCMMVCPTDAVRVTGRGLSPADIAPMPAPESRTAPEQLEALMQARRSVRHFQDKAVDGGLVDRVLAAAAKAPMGIPPSEVGVIVLQGKERVSALSRDVAGLYAGMLKYMDSPWRLRLLRPFVKKSFYRQLCSFILPLGRGIVEADRQGRDVVLYGAPVAMLFHTSPHADPSDAMIACTYAMLAAESLGLGTCMIGCVAPILDMNRKMAAKHGVPAGHKPVIVLLLGHPAVTYRQTVRRSLLSVTRR